MPKKTFSSLEIEIGTFDDRKKHFLTVKKNFVVAVDSHFSLVKCSEWMKLCKWRERKNVVVVFCIRVIISCCFLIFSNVLLMDIYYTTSIHVTTSLVMTIIFAKLHIKLRDDFYLCLSPTTKAQRNVEFFFYTLCVDSTTFALHLLLSLISNLCNPNEISQKKIVNLWVCLVELKIII